MVRRFVAPLITLLVIGLFAYATRFDRSASASPQELTVISRTRGGEVLTAQFVDNEVKVKLKNNHKDTITAFAIGFRDSIIMEDFVYSDVHFGIEPGDTFEKSYSVSPSPIGSQHPTVYLLTILLKSGTQDGNSKVAKEIEDVRLGEKIQILRTLKILEKEGQIRKDLKTIKSDLVAALNAGEFETRMILNELHLNSRSDSTLSDKLRAGLQWGRDSILQRFEEIEKLPTESQERGLMRLKERSQKLLAKL